jgi:hypothetical protein
MKKNIIKVLLLLIAISTAINVSAQSKKAKAITKKVTAVLPKTVSDKVMQGIYKEIKTPYKYGLVIATDDNAKKADCPSVFRKGNGWYMTYLIFNGRGYETWLAESKDLLHWTTKGHIMSFSDTTSWDQNQKAGYIALQDLAWGGTYALQQYQGKYWMSYFGGKDKGYEKGLLSIGIASTTSDPSTVHEWDKLDHPVLMATDANVSWWDNHTLYKETVIWDKANIPVIRL